MVKCDQGYLCEICGEEVELIRDSDLYLRFVTGQIDSRELLASPERHIRCNAVVAQFVVAPEFEVVEVEGPFRKSEMDSGYVAKQEALITRGWQRLQELTEIADTLPVSDYPLSEFRTQSNPGR
ncbi:MAG TPA: hypothetical protein EYG03_12220 [Planctomycetes bacterium]|nr:hypothetical protein [Fuerstiella sp.]HIK92733.1 hypothetical protein [Planctomycetota bacterium]